MKQHPVKTVIDWAIRGDEWLARHKRQLVAGAAGVLLGIVGAKVFSDEVVTYEYQTAWTTTGVELLFSWCDTEASEYEIEVMMFPARTVVHRAMITSPQHSWVPPAKGHYTFRVRSKVDGEWGEWVESHTQHEALGDPSPGCTKRTKGWFLFAELPTLEDVVIE